MIQLLQIAPWIIGVILLSVGALILKGQKQQRRPVERSKPARRQAAYRWQKDLYSK